MKRFVTLPVLDIPGVSYARVIFLKQPAGLWAAWSFSYLYESVRRLWS